MVLYGDVLSCIDGAVITLRCNIFNYYIYHTVYYCILLLLYYIYFYCITEHIKEMSVM